MALTRECSAQISAVLKAMRAKGSNTSAIIAQMDQLSINYRRHLFATTGKNSMLQLAFRQPSGDYLAYMLEQHANDPSLPLDVDFIRRYTRDHGNRNDLSWSSSPLWLAALLKKVSVVALLLAHGADVNDTLIGYTPLHACLYRPIRSADTLRIAEMLMNHGVSLTYADSKCMLNCGVTPLVLAARNHPQLVAVILERLRAAGHNVSKYVQARDRLGRTALHYATGGNTNSLADVDVVTSLCKEGTDLYARDFDGRDAFMACCYWLNERSNGLYLTPSHVWSRINYWIGVFQPSLVRQWQVWELVGAQASLDLFLTGNDEQYANEEELGLEYSYIEPDAPKGTDQLTFYEQALTVRQLLSPEDIPPIPVIPLFATYVEPVTVEALRQLGDDYSLMLQHAVQVRRRHLGDNSLAVSSALDKCANYLDNIQSAQRAFECRLQALRLRASIKELLRIKAADEQQLHAYLACVKHHLVPAFLHFDKVYNRQGHIRRTPVQDKVWDDAVVVMQAAVDETVLNSMTQGGCGLDILEDALILVTRCLGPFNNKRSADLQRIMNGLVIASSGDKFQFRHQKIFFHLFDKVITALVKLDTGSNFAAPNHEAEDDIVEYVDDSDSDSEHDFDIDNWGVFPYKYLTPNAVVFVARAARHGGVSLDSLPKGEPETVVAPLFVCAQLLAKPWPITEKSKDDLRRVMELLVDEGGAHWDAADNTHNTAVCHFDSVTVSRYMNLQCLAARIVNAHVTSYDVYLPASLVNFVKLH